MPNFFDEVDSTGVVENHIKEVLKLQDKDAQAILKDYQSVKNDLIDRLSRLPPGRFTAQHMRGVLAQVEGAITAIQEHLNGEMAESAYQTALKGIDDLLKELKVFDEEFTGAVTPVNLNAALVARDTSNLLATKYETNLDQYGNNLYQRISNALFEATLGTVTTDQIIGRLSQGFTGHQWELTRIIRTELHHVYNLGKLNSLYQMAEEEEGLKKTLIHPMDSRTGEDSEYAASLHLVADLDEPFEYEWPKGSGKIRSFMAPPDRPNDRSVLVPYRRDWGYIRGDAFIPINSQAPRNQRKY